MSNGTKAIETRFDGYLFRSRLEARWAVFFKEAGIEYQYEPEGFEFEDGTKYLPDFWIPQWETWCEVKPGKFGRLPRVYLAGKMDNWRASVTSVRCNNPYVCFDGHYDNQFNVGGGQIVADSMDKIGDSDALIAYINPECDCYGTLAEIGFACGLRKNVLVCVDKKAVKFFDCSGHGIGWETGDPCGHKSYDNDQTHGQRVLMHKFKFGEVWFAAIMAAHRGGCLPVDGVNELDRIVVNHLKLVEEDEVKSRKLAQSKRCSVLMLRDIADCAHRVKQFKSDLICDDFIIKDVRALLAARSARFEFGQSGAR